MTEIAATKRSERLEPFVATEFQGVDREVAENINAIDKIVYGNKGFNEVPTAPDINKGQLDERFPKQYIAKLNGEKLNIQIGNKEPSKRETIKVGLGNKADVAFRFWQVAADGKSAICYAITSDGKIYEKSFDQKTIVTQNNGSKVNSWTSSKGNEYTERTDREAANAHMKLAIELSALALGRIV